MVDLLTREKMDITWSCEGVRINMIKKMDHNFLNSLEKSGLRWIAMGVESGSERILRLLRKGISVEDVVSVNKKLSKHRLIIPQYNFMCAIPTETMGDLKKTTDIILRLLRDNHPVFTQLSTGSDEIGRILQACASIIDTLNPLRNRLSVAHPNEQLLMDEEAMLVVNIVRTLLYYFNTKFTSD